MKLQRLLLLFIATSFLTNCTSSQELTRNKAKTIMNKVAAAQPPTDQIVLGNEQVGILFKTNPKAMIGLHLRTFKQCVLARDVRAEVGQYAVCQGLTASDIDWQKSAPAMMLTIDKPVTWIIAEVTGISDTGNSHNEKIVEYTWTFDFSAFPKETQDGFKQPYPGKSLLRLYDDGWRFVEFK